VKLRKEKKLEILKKKRQESKQEDPDQELSLSLTQALLAPQGVPLQQLK